MHVYETCMESIFSCVLVTFSSVTLETACAWHRFSVKNAGVTTAAVEVCVWWANARATLPPPSCGPKMAVSAEFRFLYIFEQMCLLIFHVSADAMFPPSCSKVGVRCTNSGVLFIVVLPMRSRIRGCLLLNSTWVQSITDCLWDYDRC